MVNVVLLKMALIKNQTNVTEMSKVLQISRTAFYNKLNGLSRFKKSEIALLGKTLELTDEESRKIFNSEVEDEEAVY